MYFVYCITFGGGGCGLASYNLVVLIHHYVRNLENLILVGCDAVFVRRVFPDVSVFSTPSRGRGAQKDGAVVIC